MVSFSTFSSSLAMYGTTLSMMSSASTPGERPAPDTDCIDVITTFSMPNAASSGFKRDRQPHGRAVRPRRHEALPAAPLPLHVDELRVIEVHRRQEHRHVRLVAERRRRRDDRHLLREARLEQLGRVALDGGEDEVDAVRASSAPRPRRSSRRTRRRAACAPNHDTLPPASRIASPYFLPAERSDAPSLTTSNSG